MTTRKYFNNIKPLHFTRPESRKAQLSQSVGGGSYLSTYL